MPNRTEPRWTGVEDAVRVEHDRSGGRDEGLWQACLAWFAPDAARRAEAPAFSYRVLEPADKRRDRRTRLRLRTAKLVTGRNRFLTECRLLDRSASGARLELVRNVELTPVLRLFDDETGLLFAVEPVWTGHGSIGVVLGPRLDDPGREVLSRSHYGLA